MIGCCSRSASYVVTLCAFYTRTSSKKGSPQTSVGRSGRDRRVGRLAAANLGIEKLRVLCRLAKDLRHLDPRRYAHAARALDEAGRLVGGWRKAHDAAQP